MQALPRLQHAEESSFHPLQLQHAASPPQHGVPSAIAAFTLDMMHVQMPADTPAQVPVSVIDSLLNGF